MHRSLLAGTTLGYLFMLKPVKRWGKIKKGLKEESPDNYRGSLHAPVARLELATRGLTVRCSNQLSYTGIVDSALRVWQNQVDNLLTFEYCVPILFVPIVILFCTVSIFSMIGIRLGKYCFNSSGWNRR